MSYRRFAVAAFAVVGSSSGLLVAACSSSSTSTPSSDVDGAVGTDNEGGIGTPVDSSAPLDAAKEAAPEPENDCTTFVDRTADGASRNIEWDLGVVNVPERCIKVKAGQTVSWVNATAGVADFDMHPIIVYKVGGGTAPTVDKTTGKATFSAAASFGFACEIHGQMRGVVLVE